MNEAEVYQVWEYSCPSCGEMVRVGQDLTDETDDCYTCGETIRLVPN